jgi:hypothetical protein
MYPDRTGQQSNSALQRTHSRVTSRAEHGPRQPSPHLMRHVGPTGTVPTRMGDCVRIVFASLLILGYGARAFAICPGPTPKVCAEFFESDAVFVGKVLSKRWGDDYIRFRVAVSKVLRGAVGKTVVVYTENASARLTWDVGRTYVVFAQLRDGRLESWDYCGPLSDPTKVADTLREIELLPSQRGASVEGQVLHQDGMKPGVPGVEIRVVGDGVAYTAVTDERGQFHMSLPPGQYQMPIDESRLVQSTYNMNTDLQHLSLVDGQCAQVLLNLR